MAYSDLTYEPVTLGGQPALRFSGGAKPFTLIGPEAERLKVAVDASRVQKVPGLITPGNINTSGLPVVWNEDGSYSTVSSMSFGNDQGEVLVPTIVDGRRVSPKEAIRHYNKTGQHLGIFKDPQSATDYAIQLHNAEQKRVGPEVLKHRLDASAPQPIALNGEQMVSGAINQATGGTGGGPIDLRGTSGAQNLESSEPTGTGGASGEWAPKPASNAGGAGAKGGWNGPSSPQQSPQVTQMGISTPGGGNWVDVNGTPMIQEPARAGTKAGYVPTARATEIQGAHPLNPELMAGMEDAYNESIGQQTRLRDLNIQEARATQEATQAELAKQGAAVATQEAWKQQLRNEVTAADARRQAAEDDFAAGRVDPNRVFSGEAGTLRAIGSAIAQALGTFGGALSRSPNYAAQIVQAAIDRDVDAQKEEIRVKGQAADNALRDLMDKKMSLSEAENALRGMQTQYAATQLANMKAQFGADRAAIEGDANLTALYQGYQKWKADYLRSAEGEATLRMSEAYRMGSPGSRGGLRFPTAAESGQVGTAKQAWNKGMGGGKQELSNPQARKAAGMLAQMNQIYDLIKDMPDNERLPAAETQGAWTRTVAQPAKDFIYGPGEWVKDQPPETQKAISLQRRVVEQATAMNSVNLEQGVLREPEYERAYAAFTSSGDWGGMKEAMKTMINLGQAKLNAIQGAPTGAQEVESSQ